ncbi:MAG: hypothetical protein H0T84_01285 [Tatlockia sp.]|nr:hypothetical protein [Tatlockia sp.]
MNKYIAMKVLLEARRNAEEKSSLNLTAQFRKFASLFDGEAQFNVETGFPKGLNPAFYKEYQKDALTNGYRVVHVNEIGFFSSKRKHFNLYFDENNNICTQKVYVDIVTTIHSPNFSDPVRWDKLNEKSYLLTLFAEIKNETEYENTFGYDLICAATYCSNGLLFYSLLSKELSLTLSLFLIPLAIILSLTLYALILPAALVFIAVEHVVINPVKKILESILPGEHDAFIEAVTSTELSI